MPFDNKTLNLRDILQNACNGCNLWPAKKGLTKLYFRQPLGNPTYSSPNLATLAHGNFHSPIIQLPVS